MCICKCICICLCFCIIGRLHFLFFVRFFLLRPLSNCILNQLSNHVAVGWQTHLFSLKPAQTHTHIHNTGTVSDSTTLTHSNTLTHFTKLTLPTTLYFSLSVTLKCKSKCKSSPNFAFVSHHFPTPFASPLSLLLLSLQVLSNCQQRLKLSLFSVHWEVFQLILMCEN